MQPRASLEFRHSEVMALRGDTSLKIEDVRDLLLWILADGVSTDWIAVNVHSAVLQTMPRHMI